jgi:hypothetical protein
VQIAAARVPLAAGFRGIGPISRLALVLLLKIEVTNTFMARKLYIFNPTARARNEGQRKGPVKWLGSYSGDYTYLGDYFARMLGVGNRLPNRRVPQWLHSHAAAVRQAKGGASRYDPGFRGWGS